VLLLALKHAPRMNDKSDAERYTVRLLKAPRIQPETRPSVRSGQSQTTLHTAAHDIAPGGGPPEPSVPAELAQLPQRSQTLVQPDAPADLLLPQETPVPLAVMWSPDNSPSKVLVAPPQQEPTIAVTRPALIKPNRESNLSDLNITMTPFPSRTPVLPPGTTSPIIVRGVEEIRQIPSTSTAQLEPPTPARVLSISSLQAQGAVVIPFANRSSESSSSALVISTATGKNSGKTGAGNPVSNQGGTGPGETPGSTKGDSVSGTGTNTQSTVAIDQNGGSTSGLTSGGELSLTHLTLAKDGQFGVVVVGSSSNEEYPEIVGIWNARLVYTVYLHIGLGKNWILQYSLPRADEAAAGGSINRPEAPWPYDIMRPHLNPEDYTSDAIMVHGFVNAAGRFERLALVFPTGFTQTKFVLNALQQWQFRPARQDGHIAAVEVLLIIPEETE